MKSVAWWHEGKNNVKVTDWTRGEFGWKNPDGKNPESFITPDNLFTDVHRRGYYVYMPMILCQKAVK